MGGAAADNCADKYACLRQRSPQHQLLIEDGSCSLNRGLSELLEHGCAVCLHFLPCVSSQCCKFLTCGSSELGFGMR